ncbi:hypothetical protein [Aureliella helgolandensis]|nr:hypothetical protein [Aureliella helgolandensis]
MHMLLASGLLSAILATVVTGTELDSALPAAPSSPPALIPITNVRFEKRDGAWQAEITHCLEHVSGSARIQLPATSGLLPAHFRVEPQEAWTYRGGNTTAPEEASVLEHIPLGDQLEISAGSTTIAGRLVSRDSKTLTLEHTSTVGPTWHPIAISKITSYRRLDDIATASGSLIFTPAKVKRPRPPSPSPLTITYVVPWTNAVFNYDVHVRPLSRPDDRDVLHGSARVTNVSGQIWDRQCKISLTHESASWHLDCDALQPGQSSTIPFMSQGIDTYWRWAYSATTGLAQQPELHVDLPERLSKFPAGECMVAFPGIHGVWSTNASFQKNVAFALPSPPPMIFARTNSSGATESKVEALQGVWLLSTHQTTQPIKITYDAAKLTPSKLRFVNTTPRVADYRLAFDSTTVTDAQIYDLLAPQPLTLESEQVIREWSDARLIPVAKLEILEQSIPDSAGWKTEAQELFQELRELANWMALRKEAARVVANVESKQKLLVGFTPSPEELQAVRDVHNWDQQIGRLQIELQRLAMQVLPLPPPRVPNATKRAF